MHLEFYWIGPTLNHSVIWRGALAIFEGFVFFLAFNEDSCSSFINDSCSSLDVAKIKARFNFDGNQIAVWLGLDYVRISLRFVRNFGRVCSNFGQTSSRRFFNRVWCEMANLIWMSVRMLFAGMWFGRASFSRFVAMSPVVSRDVAKLFGCDWIQIFWRFWI